jgi:hypothetical protein
MATFDPIVFFGPAELCEEGIKAERAAASKKGFLTEHELTEAREVRRKGQIRRYEAWHRQ